MTEYKVRVERVRKDTIDVTIAMPEVSSPAIAYVRACEAAAAIPDGIEWKPTEKPMYTAYYVRKIMNNS
jgi:hypothetical protein